MHKIHTRVSQSTQFPQNKSFGLIPFFGPLHVEIKKQLHILKCYLTLLQQAHIMLNFLISMLESIYFK